MNKATALVVNRATRLGNRARRLGGLPPVGVVTDCTGRPQKEVDYSLAEQLLSDPTKTHCQVAKMLGVNRGTLYRRIETDAQFRAIYSRAISRREFERKRLGICPHCGVPRHLLKRDHGRAARAIRPETVFINRWAYFINL
jgi:hypothetical protein